MTTLTEMAKRILTEGNYPEVRPDGAGSPDRDANKSTPAAASLKPNSKTVEGRFSNPNATPPEAPDNSVEDLGPALVKNTDTPPSAKAANKMSRDTSKAAKASVAPEPIKKQSAVMEEDAETEGDQISEENLDEEIEAFITHLAEEGLDEDAILEAVQEEFGIEINEEDIDEEETIEEETIEEETQEQEIQIDMSEHVEALFAGEELSEEFKEKAITIFEAAVRQKLEEEVKKIEEAYAETLAEEISKTQTELTENVDDYLNYVVEQWVAENEVAIESNLRTELTEDFIAGLRQLFAENYIDIPEDKVSMVEEMASKVEELEAKLNEEIERNVALNKTLNESTKYSILADACEGLTATQAEKLKSLAEGVAFTTEEEYAQKVNIIKENYFAQKVSNDQVLDSDKSNENPTLTEEVNGRMGNYVRVLGGKLPN